MVSASVMGLTSAMLHHRALGILASSIEVQQIADKSVALSVEGLALRGDAAAKRALEDVAETSKMQQVVQRLVVDARTQHRWNLGIWVGVISLQLLFLPVYWKRK